MSLIYTQYYGSALTNNIKTTKNKTKQKHLRAQIPMVLISDVVEYLACYQCCCRTDCLQDGYMDIVYFCLFCKFFFYYFVINVMEELWEYNWEMNFIKLKEKDLQLSFEIELHSKNRNKFYYYIPIASTASFASSGTVLRKKKVNFIYVGMLYNTKIQKYKYRAQVIHKALWVGITMSTTINSKNSFVFFFQRNPRSKYNAI